MAYTQEKKDECYRSDNARKTNSKLNPDGYLYLIKLNGFDIYKIGVSSNPKRRIKDLKSANPFDIEIIFLAYFEDVYQLESLVLDLFTINKIKGEWFKAYEEDISNLKIILSDLYKKENYGSTKRK